MIIIKYFKCIIILLIGVLISPVFAQPVDTVLQNMTISTEEFFGATNSITIGPDFTVTSAGSVTLVSPNISFMNMIFVVGGGELYAVTGSPPVGIKSENSITPTKFILVQNYPNPFNSTTTIDWQSPISGWQTLKVYDALGNEVATLVNEYKPAGKYEIEFNAANLASGIYYYRLTAGNFSSAKKMILLK
jgi:Secretion system C-terminal sorting domain